MQDMAALNTLEKLIGREKAVALLDKVDKFTEYPHDEAWMLETREKINALIKENIK